MHSSYKHRNCCIYVGILVSVEFRAGPNVCLCRLLLYCCTGPNCVIIPGPTKKRRKSCFRGDEKFCLSRHFFLYERGWRDSSVSIVTSLRAAQFVAIPAGERYFYLLQNVQTDSGAAAASCLMCTGLLLRR